MFWKGILTVNVGQKGFVCSYLLSVELELLFVELKVFVEIWAPGPVLIHNSDPQIF